MPIETIQEYQVQEVRLEEIKGLLEEMIKKDSIDLSKVVALREEARTLALDLKSYLRQTFETQN